MCQLDDDIQISHFMVHIDIAEMVLLNYNEKAAAVLDEGGEEDSNIAELMAQSPLQRSRQGKL